MEEKRSRQLKEQLDNIQNILTDKEIKRLSKEELEEYIIQVSRIKGRIQLLESLERKEYNKWF